MRKSACWLLAMHFSLALLAPLHGGETATSPAAAESPPPPASPEKGWELLRTRAYLPPDFDQAIFDDLWMMWDAAERNGAAKMPLAERRQAIADHYGLVVDPESPPGEFRLLGYVATPQGWAMNCLSCHGGMLEGRAVAGMGNNRIALQSLTEDVRKVKLLRLRKLSHLDLAIVKLPLNVTNGTTNSVIFGVVLGAIRNPDMTVDKSRPIPPLLHHDMDAPPWWRLPKKSRLYADGFAPKNHRTIMQFMMIPQHNREVFTGWEEDFRHILAWMEQVKAPPYPKPIDAGLAAEGKLVFERRCAECHGHYGENASYPETVVPLDVVKTDAARLNSLTHEHREWMKLGWMSHFGADRVDTDPAGYVAPPLDGIWASAPYLHNGSVPTLEALLDSSSRPKIWRQEAGTYDHQRVGIQAEAFDAVPADVGTHARRWYFDTSLFGKSNGGHTFGDSLTAAERRAVIEYLKGL